MRYVFVFILLSMSIIYTVAQDWSIALNCMGDLTYPVVARGNWDFQGVIISSVYPDGIRGMRADRNVEYYIALESDNSFPAAGAISPDGYYFAYPVGSTTFRINTMGDDLLGVDYLRIVRTDGVTDETYRFEVNNYTYAGLGRSFNLDAALWIGAEVAYYPDLGAETFITDFRTGETHEWSLSISPAALTFAAPDGTRAFHKPLNQPATLYNLTTDVSLSYPMAQQIVWLADSSAFLALGDSGINIVDRNGNIIEAIEQTGIVDIAVAPNGTAFAFWDEEQQLFIGDMRRRVIYDMCFQGKDTAVDITYYYPNLAWSPDSRSLAFAYDSYVAILDTHTFENQIIEHYAKQVMAWVPLQGETIEPNDVGIHPPQATVILTPTVTPSETPQVATCQLEVLTGANLRSGAGVDFEQVGSAAVGFSLTADAQQFNTAEYFRWWRLTTGEWIREDFTSEDAACEFLPQISTP